jgi:hypothetical protein
MSDEFDEILEPIAPRTRVTAPTGGRPAPWWRGFRCRRHPLRVRLLRCLMRPLGPLGAAGVAAGAFAAFLDPRGGGEPVIDLGRGAGVQQAVHELARFVEQVEPQALQQFAGLVSSSSLAMATFSASALVLLYRRLQPVGGQAQPHAAKLNQHPQEKPQLHCPEAGTYQHLQRPRAPQMGGSLADARIEHPGSEALHRAQIAQRGRGQHDHRENLQIFQAVGMGVLDALDQRRVVSGLGAARPTVDRRTGQKRRRVARPAAPASVSRRRSP